MTTLFPEALAARAVGNCSLCGRPLTDPESVRRGVGPVCCPPPPKPPRPVADHPSLPGMPRPLATIDQDAPAGARTALCPPSPASRPQEADPRQVALPRANGPAGDALGAATAPNLRAVLTLRGVAVEVEDDPAEAPVGMIHRLLERWLEAGGAP